MTMGCWPAVVVPLLGMVNVADVALPHCTPFFVVTHQCGPDRTVVFSGSTGVLVPGLARQSTPRHWVTAPLSSRVVRRGGMTVKHVVPYQGQDRQSGGWCRSRTALRSSLRRIRRRGCGRPRGGALAVLIDQRSQSHRVRRRSLGTLRRRGRVFWVMTPYQDLLSTHHRFFGGPVQWCEVSDQAVLRDNPNAERSSVFHTTASRVQPWCAEMTRKGSQVQVLYGPPHKTAGQSGFSGGDTHRSAPRKYRLSAIPSAIIHGG